jgi:rifampin ADP-ribosylating transferase
MKVPNHQLDNGPFFHGTKAALPIGAELYPGYRSNFESGRTLNHIYFTATLDTAKGGAELALGEEKECIYLVEPLGEFENDPNLTDKRFPGNPTRSYRSTSPLKIVAELGSWERHSQEEIDTMLEHLKKLREAGKAEIED